VSPVSYLSGILKNQKKATESQRKKTPCLCDSVANRLYLNSKKISADFFLKNSNLRNQPNLWIVFDNV